MSAMVSFEVVVPPGMKPGQKVRIKMPNGRATIVTIPANAVAGQKFRVGQPTAVKARQLQPEPERGSGSGGSGGGRARSHTHAYGVRGGLLDVAGRGDVNGIRAALEAGADPDAVELDADGWFPLAAAAQNCDCDCMEALLVGGADPNQVFAQTERSAAMLCADMDVELGATVELGGGEDAEDAIHAVEISSKIAYHKSILRMVRKSSCRALALLASHGADMAARDAGGDSAATLAAGSADSQSLALLCALGVDMRRGNLRGETPLLLAAKRRSVGGVAVLLGNEHALAPERAAKAQSMLEVGVAAKVDMAGYVKGSRLVQLADVPIKTLVELLCVAVQREHIPLCFLVLRETEAQRLGPTKAGRSKGVLELMRLEDSYGLTALQHASYLVDVEARKDFTTLLTRVGADVCAALRVGRMDIPPIRKQRGVSLAGSIVYSEPGHLTPGEALFPNASEILATRLRGDAEHRPEKWTVRALRSTYGHVQNRTALHFAALTSKADTGGAWAKVLLEHGSPIVRDLFGATALHLAAAHVNVGAMTAILDAVSNASQQEWGELSQDEIVNMEDNMHQTPLDLLYETLDMLDDLSTNCSCSCFDSKVRDRRWRIFRRASRTEALDEIFATCGGFGSKSARITNKDDDERAIHEFMPEHVITKNQFEEIYLQKVGVTGNLTDEIWWKIHTLTSAENGNENETESGGTGNKLHVGGLGNGYNDEGELRDLFSRFGTVDSVACRAKHSGSEGSWALVTMDDTTAAEAVLSHFSRENDGVLTLGSKEVRLTVQPYNNTRAGASTGAMKALKLPKMNRSEFGLAVSALGRGASIFQDFVLVCDIEGNNPMRVLDLLEGVMKEGDTVQHRVDALRSNWEACERLLLTHGAHSKAARNWKHYRRNFNALVWAPVAFVWGAAVLVTKPMFVSCQSMGELSAFPCHDKGHKGQKAAAAAYLFVVAVGCWVLPLMAATTDDIESRTAIATTFRWFFVLMVLLTQLLGLRRIMAESEGFFPDPAEPDGGPDPHAKKSKNDDTVAAPTEESPTLMSSDALLAFTVPSKKYQVMHGYWVDGEEGRKQTGSSIKLLKLKTSSFSLTRTTCTQQQEEDRNAAIHMENPHHTVQPRHTALPVKARLNFGTAKFVLFQILEILQLASLPVHAPDPGEQEHKWLPGWFQVITRHLRVLMIELPDADYFSVKMLNVGFGGAVVFCCVWAFVCGFMMLGLISRQRAEVQSRLPAFAPDFLFRMMGLVEFLLVGPCGMIVTKWLLRPTDCTYLKCDAPEALLEIQCVGKVADPRLYFDMDPTIECFEGSHTFRAALAATLLILYTVTTANFAPSFFESWSDKKDIRIRPTFVATASFVKLVSVCVAVLATRVTWAMVLFPVVGSFWLLWISMWVNRPTNIEWVDRLISFGYATLLWHSICIAMAWSVQDITKEATPCPTTTGGLAVESSVPCVEEQEHLLAGTFRLVPAILHQVGIITICCCFSGLQYCGTRHRKVQVLQASQSEMGAVRAEADRARKVSRKVDHFGHTASSVAGERGSSLAVEVDGSMVDSIVNKHESEDAGMESPDAQADSPTDWLSKAERTIVGSPQ